MKFVKVLKEMTYYHDVQESESFKVTSRTENEISPQVLNPTPTTKYNK